MGHRQWEQQMWVGEVKIGNFQQLTHNNLKTVQDWCIVSVKV